MGVLLGLFLITIYIQQGAGNLVDQPYEWTLARWDDQTVIGTNITAGAPTFRAPLCQLAPIQPCLNLKAYYVCPASNPGKGYCNYPNEYYCAYWDCVTLAAAWKPDKADPFLKTEWGPDGCTPPRYDSSGGTVSQGSCTHIKLTILQPDNFGWATGKIWGVRYWEPGKDRGGLILIRKGEAKTKPQGVGPNKVTRQKLGKSNITHSPENTTFGLVENNPLSV